MTAAGRPRVVFVNRYFYPDLSATSQMLTRVAVALAAAGVDVHVVCSRQLYERAGAKLPRNDDHAEVRIHRAGSTAFGRAALAGRLLDYVSFHVGAAIALLRVLRRGDVVVAKTDPPMLSVTAMLPIRLRGAILVNWLQDLFPEVALRLGVGRLPAPAQAALLWLRDRSLHGAAMNVVLGERMRDWVGARGVATSKLRVIPNTADGPNEPWSTGVSRLRAGTCPGARFVVAYSGNLGRAHDAIGLRDAIELLRDDATLRFLMIGGGDGMRRLQADAHDRGWRNVVFLPYQDGADLADSLAAADVHLVSLRPALEGLIVPSKIYGILAAARPVVFIGDVDGEIGRLVLDTHCGVVVADGDGAALAAALRALAEDELSVVRMGRLARQAYLARFDPLHVVAAWVELLFEVAPETLRRVSRVCGRQVPAVLPPQTAPGSCPPPPRSCQGPVRL